MAAEEGINLLINLNNFYIHFIAESIVPQPPTRIRVSPSAKSIMVSWSSPPPASNLMVRGYTIGWGKGVADQYQSFVDANTHVYTIKNLREHDYCKYCHKFLDWHFISLHVDKFQYVNSSVMILMQITLNQVYTNANHS